jgi:hypothetical protein
MYKHENAWRHRTHTNKALLKYTPDVLRTVYFGTPCPPMPDYPDLSELMSADTLLPALSAGEEFGHSLGLEINSRKVVPRERRQDHVPEWYSEPVETKVVAEAKGPEVEVVKAEELKPKEKIKVEVIKNVKNLQPQASAALITKPQLVSDEDAKFSRLDELFELRLKQQSEEPEEAMPEWADFEPHAEVPEKTQPKYHSDVIKEQLVEGNPFSSILLDGVTMDEEGFICPTTKSKAYERVWYYRDPQGEVQGAFDSVEMFNWYAAGYFTEDLHVSYASRLQFVPLSFFIEQQKQLLSNLVSHPEPPRDVATKELKSMLGIKPSPWGSRQPVPTSSLSEIQRQQAKSKQT